MALGDVAVNESLAFERLEEFSKICLNDLCGNTKVSADLFDDLSIPFGVAASARKSARPFHRDERSGRTHEIQQSTPILILRNANRG